MIERTCLLHVVMLFESSIVLQVTPNVADHEFARMPIKQGI